jgi:two-component system phosphate regulon response regulator PhoB
VSVVEDSVIQVGPLHVDTLARRAVLVDTELSLTALQFDLLLIFVQNSGKLLKFDELQSLLERLQTGRKDPAIVRYHVARLRARLGSYGDLIENVRGCGYRMRLVSSSSIALDDQRFKTRAR